MNISNSSVFIIFGSIFALLFCICLVGYMHKLYNRWRFVIKLYFDYTINRHNYLFLFYTSPFSLGFENSYFFRKFAFELLELSNESLIIFRILSDGKFFMKESEFKKYLDKAILLLKLSDFPAVYNYSKARRFDDYRLNEILIDSHIKIVEASPNLNDALKIELCDDQELREKRIYIIDKLAENALSEAENIRQIMEIKRKLSPNSRVKNSSIENLKGYLFYTHEDLQAILRESKHRADDPYRNDLISLYIRIKREIIAVEHSVDKLLKLKRQENNVLILASINDRVEVLCTDEFIKNSSTDQLITILNLVENDDECMNVRIKSLSLLVSRLKSSIDETDGKKPLMDLMMRYKKYSSVYDYAKQKLISVFDFTETELGY